MTYPNTIGTDFIRRTGLSDIYSLTPGATLTVSVNKRGGLYAGAVVYTTDTFLTKFSAWTAVSSDDTVDVADVAIPAAATGVAFVCSAITDTVTPRVGAELAIKDANVANSLTRHQRFRYGSGDGALPAFTEFDPTPLFMQNAPIAIRADKLSTLWLDAAGTMPALGTLDEQIERIDNSGTLNFSLTELAAGDHAFYTPAGLGGLPTIRGNGSTSVLTGVPGTAFTTADSGLCMLAIGVFPGNSFTTMLEFEDGASDGWRIAQSGNDASFVRNEAGTSGSTGGTEQDFYMFFNWNVDKTRGNSDCSFMSFAPPMASVGFGATTNPGDISATAVLSLFANTGGTVNGAIEFSEVYFLDRILTTQEEIDFVAYAESTYGIVHA